MNIFIKIFSFQFLFALSQLFFLFVLVCTSAIAGQDDPILAAIEEGDIEAVQSLMAGELDPNAPTSSGEVPLFSAVLKKDAAIVKILIDSSADVDAIKNTDESRTTLLHLAVLRGSLEIVNILINSEAKIDPNNDRGFTPLSIAAARNNLPILKALAAAGADINTKTHSGLTPLVSSIKTTKGNEMGLFLEQAGAVFDVDGAVSRNCDNCHSTGGIGVSAKMPNLAGQHKEYLVKQLMDYRDGNRSNRRMAKASSALTDKIIVQLAEYYSSQNAIKQVTHTDSDKFRRGQILFNEKVTPNGLPSCAGCHGIRGLGLAGSMIPHIAGLHNEYIAVQLKSFRKGKRDNESNGAMRLVSETLEDSAIEDLAFYVRHMH